MKINKRSGFTLIEMIVVLGILVILAGLVVGKLDLLDMKANKGVAASNMAGVARYVQTYRVNTTLYPDGWDRLLDTTNTNLWSAPSASGPGLIPDVTGNTTVVPSAATKLKTLDIPQDGTLGNAYQRSLARIGITRLNNLAGSFGLPGDAYTGSTTTFAGTATVRVATINDADGDGAAMLANIFPSTNVTAGTNAFYPTSTSVPADTILLVVGLGPRNTLIGADQGGLLLDAPFYANTNQAAYYNRFLCVFQAFKSGKRARLVAVVGSDGDRMVEEIADYYTE